MLVHKISILVRISILLAPLYENIWSTAVNTEIQTAASLDRQGISDPLLQLYNDDKGISEGLGSSTDCEAEDSKSINLSPIKRDNLKSSDCQMNTVESPNLLASDPAGIRGVESENQQVNLLPGEGKESGEASDATARIENLHIAQKSESHAELPSSKSAVYKYDKINPTPKLESLESYKGFFKSTCFKGPTAEQGADEYCIFINPTINKGQGMVIVAPPKVFEGSLKDGLSLLDDEPIPVAMKVVEIPETGDKKVVAARNLGMGDYVERARPVGIFSDMEPIWKTPLGYSIRRQAIDHLPLQTRAAVASLPTEGYSTTEDHFISGLIDHNTVITRLLYEGQSFKFVSLFLNAPLIRHSCQPNALGTMNYEEQSFHIKTFEPIAEGEEITIAYDYADPDPNNQQRKLPYRFVCTCDNCRSRNDLGEKHYKQVERISELVDLSKDSKISAHEAEELIELCKERKFPWGVVNSHHIAANLYDLQGNTEKAREHIDILRGWRMVWKEGELYILKEPE